MKIVELCSIDLTMEIFLMELNQRLMREGYELICVCSRGLHTEKLINQGFNVTSVKIDRKLDLVSNLKSIYKLYKVFKEEKPDIVHVHTPIASVLGRIAAKLANVPIIIHTAHGFYFHENMNYIKYRIFFTIEKYLCRYCTDFLFTQSDEDRKTALKNKFLNETKVLTIGNGVDVIHRFNPNEIDKIEVNYLYDELGLSKENIIITFIGRLVKEKGILDLLDAFNNIKNEDVRLLIVGDITQGSRDKNTKEIIRKMYGDNKNIRFLGQRSDIENILYITDVFCLPSYREGMPRSIIEAMAMECAVLATNIRGSREEVVDGKTGFLITLGSPEDIRDKIEILVNDSELLYKMKKEGRKRAEEFFNEDHVVNRQLCIINKLCNDTEKNK